MWKIKIEDNAEEGVRRSIRDDQPSHYTFKIESFSLLSKSPIDIYESSDFEVGGYKWKLSIYPNGNEDKNGKDHISLYLVMAETSSLPPGWEVKVVFKLFLFDQIRDNYLTLEDIDGRGKRFHGMKTKRGFTRFIPLSTFTDPSNGYLVDDTCVFGAEVFVIKSTGKGECLSMVKGAINGKHTWKIENFSRLQNERYISDVFIVGAHKWNVELYPKGASEAKNNSLSMFLNLADSSTATPGQKVYTEFRLRVRNQSFDKHIEFKVNHWFSASSSNTNWGWRKFMGLDDLKDPKNGFLVKDSCIVEAEVTVLAKVNKLP